MARGAAARRLLYPAGDSPMPVPEAGSGMAAVNVLALCDVHGNVDALAA